MTALQKMEANELREELFRRDHYTCDKCGKSIYEGIPQLAHRISASKLNIKLYGREVIYHPFNMASTESLSCNSRFNIGNNPVEVAKLVQRIKEDLDAKKAG